MLKKLFFFCVLLSSPALASDVIPQAYRAADNQYHPVMITSGLDATGKPVVGAYQDLKGQWHDATVSVQACGVDANNHPILCPVRVTENTLQDYVQKSLINTANGIASLDSNNDLTNPLTSGADWLGAWQKNATSVDVFAQGYESALFGGQTATGEGNNTFNPRSLLVQSDPYGPYSAGCATGVAMTGSVYNSQFPISQQDPHNGASAVVGVGGYDTVANCVLVADTPARLILTATGYTATSVQLATPLTAAQAAQIHPNMYITTNSPNPALSLTNTSGALPKRNLYAGFVSTSPSAGDTSISVYAWDVPGYGTKASDQIPQTDTLDTVWSAYTSPTVFLGGGAASSAFGNNWFFNLDASNLTPSTSNKSLIHQITPLEVDLNIVNGTAPNNSVDWQGISMNAGNQPAALTTDSRQIFLGGNITQHLLFDGGEGNWLINGDNIYVPSLKNQSLTAQNTAQLYQEWDQWIGGANRMRFLLWNSFDNPTAPQGWEQAVSHFGPTIDGDPVTEGDPGGSKQADIEWNRAENYGGLDLCGYGHNCGFTLTGDGNISVSGTSTFSSSFSITGGNTLYIQPSTLDNNLFSGWCAPDSYSISLCSNIGAWVSIQSKGDLRSTAGGTTSSSAWHPDGYGNWYASNSSNDGGISGGGSIASSSYTLETLPTKNELDGARLWCSDCKLNGISGVVVYWHASISKWTDSQNNTPVN